MRRLPALLATAGTALALVAVPAAPASAHSGYHRVEMSGSMDIVDDDYWGDTYAYTSFNTQDVIGNGKAHGSVFASGCAGNEVRIDHRVNLTDLDNGWVRADVDTRMYELESCSNWDLDGRKTFTFYVAPGSSSYQSYRISNTAEGGDYADLRFTVRNTLS